jgi:hypothetical protein
MCKTGERNELVEGITLFPNPFTDEFTFISESDISALNIYDVSGRLVETHQNILPDQEIKCGSMLSRGIYFAEIISSGSRRNIKLIKEN